jgi:hypothetical protein
MKTTNQLNVAGVDVELVKRVKCDAILNDKTVSEVINEILLSHYSSKIKQENKQKKRQ